MSTITIPKKEYETLLDAKLRFEHLRQVMEEDIFAPPSVKNKHEILAEFKATKKYNKSFLKSLEAGLERSTYFR